MVYCMPVSVVHTEKLSCGFKYNTVDAWDYIIDIVFLWQGTGCKRSVGSSGSMSTRNTCSAVDSMVQILQSGMGNHKQSFSFLVAYVS